MTYPCASGRIELICGCMFSGKTEELIRRINHVRIARQPWRVFSPRLDNRYGEHGVISHNGMSIAACKVSTIGEVIERCEDEPRVVAIDEIHFFDNTPEAILSGCQELADRGMRVIISGLDQDFRAEPFPAVAQLMAVAEQVDKLHAICVRCGAYATRSQRLIDGQPAPASAPTIVVGGLDLYEARCRACYVRPS